GDRRRGSGERGRPDHGGRVRHRREDRVLRPPHLGRDLPPLTGERCDELDLPLMVHDNTESHRTAFTVSVDFRHGTTTGISAADRATTIQAMIEPGTRPKDLARPGHIFPLRYREGGVLKRA